MKELDLLLVRYLKERHPAAASEEREAFEQFLELPDPEIARYLTADAIDASFDTAYHLRHVDTIFRRVFGESV